MGKTFKTQYRVMYHDADSTGHLSIPALGNYVLDTAGLHAIELGISMQMLASQGMTWVMSGMRFQIHNLPEINSTLELSTQISGYSRISSQRDFFVTCGGQKVADISTEWLIINTHTRRPVFLTDVFPQIADLKGNEPPLDRYAHIRTQMQAPDTKKITVEYSDIDINSHLYSIRYLAMALDTLGKDILSGRRIQCINANFVSEILYGNEISLLSQCCQNTHNIEMQVEGKTMFRAQVETN